MTDARAGAQKQLRAVNRALMGLYGPIKALDDAHAKALLDEADGALRRLWRHLEAPATNDGLRPNV